MYNNSPAVADSFGTSPPCNGSARRCSPLTSPGMAVGRPASLMDQVQSQPNVVRVVVHRDDHGYGMKVSGDNPVYVQSVKEGGAAERAGLHAGDKIIKVNGVNVMQSTHTQVVALIKSSREVVLTVQQRMQALRAMGSPSLHNRPATVPSPASQRITGPQPVDNETQWQLLQHREKQYRLMIEKEQRYLDQLRSDIASSRDDSKAADLAKTERNLNTLQTELLRIQAEQSADTSRYPRSVSLPTQLRPTSNRHSATPPTSPNGNTVETPPPLPKRNQPAQRSNTINNHPNYPNPRCKPLIDFNSLFLNHEINANQSSSAGADDSPPPLPPRTLQSAPTIPNNMEPPSLDAVNSINKQMSYPLVATCTTINDNSPNPTHHRTKSSPDSLLTLGNDDNARKLSESMNDLTRQEGWEGVAVDVTPPGTPPPPYPSPRMNRRDGNSNNMDEGDNSFDEHLVDGSSPEVLPFRGVGSNNSRVMANSSPIHAANSQVAQQPIRSMEDDELSDQEISELENHGHFKSLSLLWEHLPHLAVFTNYVLSNSDPNSLLFYLLTDLYKEGNAAKDMRKWAFEIHSCFLVPGAPLRLSNVDENIAREIDDVLTREYEKEEILRKIFWKARSRAKEELTRQLTYFQQNRTRGLGTIFGPTDQELNEVYHDKAKELKLYESLFLAKLEPYLDEFDNEHFDPKRYYTAAALTTVMTRIFQLRPTSHALDRCPVFVNREKSFRNKFMGKYTKKINVLNHQFIAQPYYTVIACNNCHQIIYGIAPQGYQCSACLINLHRLCVRLYDDSCPGPIKKKDRGITQWMRPDRGEHRGFRKTSHFIQTERERRHMEEQRDNSFDLNESSESKPGHPVSRSGSDRRPDAVREEAHHRHQDSDTSNMEIQSAGDNDKTEGGTPDSSISLPVTGNKRKGGSNINRSESVKEQSEKRKQRRNISDPSHNTSCDVDLDRQQTNFSKNTDSGSSSNSNVSCNGRLSESPSNSVDVHHASLRTNSESDSDMDGEAYPLTWQQLLPEEEVKNLSEYEKKRQDVINELFHTEGSHVRNLKVLYKIFYRRLQESQILKPDDLSLIFPNIKEMLDIHTEINKEMRRIRKEDPLVKESLGDTLVKLFCETQGETLKVAAATFCERQQLALEFIKKRRERDSKFDTILAECEKKRQCRRLPLQGIVPTEMQRLSKYPLLLDRLISSIEKDCNQTEELAKLKRVHQMSKEILNYVNESAKIAHNKHRLEEIQNHLDPSMFERADHSIVNEFRNFDLKRYRLLLEGSMQLRRPNKAIIPVHVLLMEEMAVILHKDGDSFLMKFFQSGSSAQPQPLSPIIKMSTLLVRRNAVCKNALFILSTSANTSQMYDLIAEDETKREWWYKHFTDAYESYNKREGKPSKRPPTGSGAGAVAADTESESEPELPSTPGAGVTDSSDRAETATTVDEESDSDRAAKKEEEVEEEAELSRDQVGGGGDLEGGVERAESDEPEMIGGGDEKIKVTAEEWPLIQPSQVNVAIPPVHTAETTLTPLEQIRRKDALVKQTLAEKEGLVADMLSIPREDFQHIADMATADVAAGGGHLTERLLASIFQVNQLQKAVNASLDITDTEVIVAKGGKHPACASQEGAPQERSVIPIVPVSLVSEIAASLSSQLTTLLSEVKEVVKERDMLRREFDKVKERLHEEHNLHSPVQYEECNSDESGPEIFSEAATGEHQ